MPHPSPQTGELGVGGGLNTALEGAGPHQTQLLSWSQLPWTTLAGGAAPSMPRVGHLRQRCQGGSHSSPELSS